jgi:hypothetical protein
MLLTRGFLCGIGIPRCLSHAVVYTRTFVHCTCNGYGMTGDRCGVTLSHLRCDPCYTLGKAVEDLDDMWDFGSNADENGDDGEQEES